MRGKPLFPKNPVRYRAPDAFRIQAGIAGRLTALREVRETLRINVSALPRGQHLREVRRRVEVVLRNVNPRATFSSDLATLLTCSNPGVRSATAEALDAVLATIPPSAGVPLSGEPSRQNPPSQGTTTGGFSQPASRTRRAGRAIQRRRLRTLFLLGQAESGPTSEFGCARLRPLVHVGLRSLTLGQPSRPSGGTSVCATPAGDCLHILLTEEDRQWADQEIQ